MKQEYVSGRGDHKTMGQAKVPAPTTDNFLKKRTKDVILPRGIISNLDFSQVKSKSNAVYLFNRSSFSEIVFGVPHLFRILLSK